MGTELLIECFTQPMVKLIPGCNLIAKKMKRELDISMEIPRHQNAEKVDLGNDIYIYIYIFFFFFLSPKSAEMCQCF